MDITRLLLIRHGQTEANRARLIQGRDDSPLTREGIETARMVAAKLAAQDLRAAQLVTFCSPLIRARETLRHVQKHLALTTGEPRYDERLVEIDFGDYTGRPVDEMMPTILRHRKDDRLAYPQGESGADLKRRVAAFLDEITTHHKGCDVLVVSHFGVIETTLKHYRTIPHDVPYRPDHEQVFRLQFGEDATPRLSVL